MPSLPFSVRVPVLARRDALWWDVLFCSMALSGQLNTQGLLGSTMLPTEDIANDMLGGAGMEQWGWLSASYTVTAGLFVILGGRLGDRFSSKFLFVAGYLLMAVFNLALGFTSSVVPFDILRAFAGVGAALVAPNVVGLVAKQYPPGPKRTVVFGVLGAAGPVGFMLHGVLASLTVEYLSARWIFWLTAISCLIFAVLSIFVIPQDGTDPMAKLDPVGAFLGLSGMVLFNLAWNQAPVVGWHQPYVPTLLGVSLVLLVLFYVWERRKGDDALVPTRLFTKDVVATGIALWWGWMSFGIWLFYTINFVRNIRGYHNALALCVQMVTITPVGVIAPLMVIWLNRHVKPHWTLAASMCGFCIGSLLMGLTPAQQSLWPMLFPAEIIVIFGPDLSFASGALIIANAVPANMGGVAGGLVLCLTNFSLGLGLGVAGTLEVHTSQHGLDILQGYRSCFWFATCISFVGLIIVLCFVRVRGSDEAKEGRGGVKEGKGEEVPV
ncbi:hypothetical protein JCM10207_000404 [Rhodosporidiobolus poonsookiae]